MGARGCYLLEGVGEGVVEDGRSPLHEYPSESLISGYTLHV